MKKRVPEDTFIEQAKLLSDAEAELLLSRMKGKLQRRFEDKKLDRVEVLAIQLEVEAEKLKEWRERLAEIRQNDQAMEKKHKKSE